MSNFCTVLISHCNLRLFYVQATTAIVDTAIVETTAIVEQKPLTTQFYLLLVEQKFRFFPKILMRCSIFAVVSTLNF